MKIKDLSQVKLLADPLKLKLIEAFAEKPKSTKQVAQELGEGVTKLYRHVDALHEGGLLKLVSEKQIRGTIERTFQAVAHRFEVDHSIFSTAADEHDDTLRQLFLETETEISKSLAVAKVSDVIYPVLSKLIIKASEEQIIELQNQIQDWIDKTSDLSKEFEEVSGEDEKAVEVSALLAFYPVKK